MSRRSSAFLLASWLLVPGLSLAQELDPEKVARIRREEKAALDEVNKKHGNKKSSEMSNAERRELIDEQAAAVAGVRSKHGVSEKEYARYTARMGPEGNEAVAAATKRMEAEEKAQKEAEAKKQAEPGEVVIQQGISDKNPVDLEGGPETGAESGPVVEQGMPEYDLFGGAGDAPPPAKKSSRGKRGSR